MIRVMLVDDEPLAREELTRLIKEDTGFQIVAESGNGEDALQKIKKNKPEVIFLDIEMPGLSGLEMASNLAYWKNPPLVVFATAYNEYAIQAFEANAIDYVLKPYDPKRLGQTFARIKEGLKGKASSRENLVSLEEDLIRKGVLKKLVGHRRKMKDRIVIDPAEVYYFRSEYAEVLARLAGEELIVRATLKELLASLDPARFTQTHRAYIVNLDKIEKVSPLFSGNFEISFKDHSLPQVPLSRRYAKNLKTLLSW